MKLVLPTSWAEIKLRQFIEINAAKEKGFEEFDLIIELLSIITDTERQKIETITLPSLSKAYQNLTWMNNFDIPDKIEPFIEVNGKHYRANLDVRKISAGQYIDLKHYTKDHKNIINNIHNILSVFYVPVGEKYNDTPANEVGEEFYEHCPITIAYPVAVFFWTLSNEWMKVTSLYLEKAMMKKAREILNLPLQQA